MNSLLQHPALVSIPAAVAVILTTLMFLKHLGAWGKSRDAERDNTLKVITKMGSDFSEVLKEFNESRVKEQAKVFEMINQQTVCMQRIIDKCEGK